MTIPLTNSFNPGQPVPCETNPPLFDPPAVGERGRDYRKPSLREQQAIDICASCPVAENCRTWALHHQRNDRGQLYDDNHIYGGMTGTDRRIHHGYTPARRRSYSNNTRDITPLFTGGCRNNHPPSSKYLRPNGDRRCRECDAAAARRKHQRDKMRKRVAA